MNTYKYRYLYQIQITNPESSFDGCYYFGQHSTNNLDDGYMGSGKLLQYYKDKHGEYGLTKTIVAFYSTQKELDAGEIQLIQSKRILLEDKCLNIADGAAMMNWSLNASDEAILRWKSKSSAARKAYWSSMSKDEKEARCELLRKQSQDIVKNSTAEQLHLRAVAGGEGNKLRLQNNDAHRQWVDYCVNRHKNMSSTEKRNIYSKVSVSLKEFYSNPENKDRVAEMKLRNRISNIESARKWRTEFRDIFGANPESFRASGNMKCAIDLYKKIRNVSKEEQENEVNRFMESITIRRG